MLLFGFVIVKSKSQYQQKKYFGDIWEALPICNCTTIISASAQTKNPGIWDMK